MNIYTTLTNRHVDTYQRTMLQQGGIVTESLSTRPLSTGPNPATCASSPIPTRNPANRIVHMGYRHPRYTEYDTSWNPTGSSSVGAELTAPLRHGQTTGSVTP